MTPTDLLNKAAKLVSGKDVINAERLYLEELHTLGSTVIDSDVLAIVLRLGELRYEKAKVYEEGERKNVRKADEFSKRYTAWENKLFRVETEAKLLGWLLDAVAPRYAARRGTR
jgi:hypothetical protein